MTTVTEEINKKIMDLVRISRVASFYFMHSLCTGVSLEHRLMYFIINM